MGDRGCDSLYGRSSVARSHRATRCPAWAHARREKVAELIKNFDIHNIHPVVNWARTTVEACKSQLNQRGWPRSWFRLAVALSWSTKLGAKDRKTIKHRTAFGKGARPSQRFYSRCLSGGSWVSLGWNPGPLTLWARAAAGPYVAELNKSVADVDRYSVKSRPPTPI